MTIAQMLDDNLQSAIANEDFTEAVLELGDNTRLCFWHRVGERGAKSVGPEAQEHLGGMADSIVKRITMFRLNSKHLDIQFDDESRWDKKIPPIDGADEVGETPAEP